MAAASAYNCGSNFGLALHLWLFEKL